MKKFFVVIFSLFFFFLEPNGAFAACAPTSQLGGTCNAPYAQCVYQGAPWCCGDGSDQFIANTECAGLTGNAQAGTGGDSSSFSSLTGTINGMIFGTNFDVNLTTPRGIISRLLPYLFTLGGLILFVMLIWGGFEMLAGAANPKSQEAGKQRMTAAVIGFLLLFASYWLAQIVQAVFGISILG